LGQKSIINITLLICNHQNKFPKYTCYADVLKFSLIFSLIGVAIGGFRWLRVVNKVQKTKEYGGKMLTLVKES